MIRGRLLRRLTAAPDPDLVHAGHRGEWLIAGIRLLSVLVLLAVPLNLYLSSPQDRGRQVVLWLGVGALVQALIVYSAVLRHRGRGWIGFLSGLLDVSLVSLCLALFVRFDAPRAALEDPVLFPVYLLAIGATSLRYDPRICVLAGLAAIVQYTALVAYSGWLTPNDAVSIVAPAQLGRLAVLAMATFLATAVVARAHDQRRRSTRDGLTNLANRGFFDESLRRLGALAERTGEQVTILMLDVDHFKRFNDAHGHLAGDRALRLVAEILARSFRSTDLVARYGGEEFAGLFPGMERADAQRRLEAIRAQIAGTAIPVDGAPAHLTVSLGVAIWPEEGADLAQTLEIADWRLYRAKQTGRDRLVDTGLPTPSTGIRLSEVEVPPISDDRRRRPSGIEGR